MRRPEPRREHLREVAQVVGIAEHPSTEEERQPGRACRVERELEIFLRTDPAERERVPSAAAAHPAR